MIYPVTLQAVGIAVGILLVLTHAVAVWKPRECERWLRDFPRSRVAATVLIVVAAVWSFLLTQGLDLGEFASLRRVLLFGIAAGAILSWLFVEEFLAVRALGMIALLAAEPILGAAFLRPEQSRLLVVVLAYVWIVLGLFWVGMPWVLRDQIDWVTRQQVRFRGAAVGGLVYGVAILGCALLFWGK